MDDLKESLRTFQAALKTAEAKHPADAYADDIEAFAESLKPMHTKVKKLLADGKRMQLRFETNRLEPLEDAIAKLIDTYT